MTNLPPASDAPGSDPGGRRRASDRHPGSRSARPPVPQRRELPEQADGSPAELGELVGLLRQVDVLMGEALRAAEAIDGHRAAAQEGMQLDPALQLHTGWTRTDLSLLLTARDVLRHVPSARGLLDDGVLSWGQVRGLVSGVRRFDREQLRKLDDHLTEHRDLLAEMDPERRGWALDELVDGLTSYRTLADRDAREPDRDHLVLTPRLDGSGSGYFDLHAESFHTVATALQDEADTPQAEPAAVEPGSDPVPLTPRSRRRSGQLADALVRLCSRRAGSSTLRPTASVVIDVDRLTGRFGGELQVALATKPPRVLRRTLERMTCDSDLELVLARGADLLAAKRYQDTLPEATRRAVAVRDGGCRFPGCRAPVSWCDVHHVVERSRHLDHHLSNLVLLCRRHHTAIHRGGWRQTLDPDGRYRLRRNGRSWTTVPRREQWLPPPDAPARPLTGSGGARAGPTRTPPGRAAPTGGTTPGSRDDELPF